MNLINSKVTYHVNLINLTVSPNMNDISH